MQAIRFDYNGKTRFGVIEKQFVSKAKVICVLIRMAEGGHKTFHMDKIENVEYLN